MLLLIPVSFSLFYGLRAVYIFGYPGKDQERPKLNKSWFFHQFWFNFAGSLAGWFLLILFGFSLDNASNIEIIHIIIFVLGLLGVVGLMPQLLAQIPEVLRLLTTKASGDVYKSDSGKTQGSD